MGCSYAETPLPPWYCTIQAFHHLRENCNCDVLIDREKRHVANSAASHMGYNFKLMVWTSKVSVEESNTLCG